MKQSWELVALNIEKRHEGWTGKGFQMLERLLLSKKKESNSSYLPPRSGQVERVWNCSKPELEQISKEASKLCEEAEKSFIWDGLGTVHPAFVQDSSPLSSLPTLRTNVPWFFTLRWPRNFCHSVVSVMGKLIFPSRGIMGRTLEDYQQSGQLADQARV